MSDKRASADLADELHALTFQLLTEEIRRYRNGEMKDANGNTLPVPTALLAQALKALKDNGVDMPAANAKRVDTLKEAMPDLDAVEKGNVIPLRR